MSEPGRPGVGIRQYKGLIWTIEGIPWATLALMDLIMRQVK